MSNAYRRSGDDESAWPDTAGRYGHDGGDQRRLEAADPARGGDRPLRALPRGQRARQTWDDGAVDDRYGPHASGRVPDDDHRPASWEDDPYPQRRTTSWADPPASRDRGTVPWSNVPAQHAGGTASSDVPPGAPPPGVRDRVGRPPAAARPPRDDDPAVDEDRPARLEPDEIEDAVPATQRLRAAVGRLAATVRSSVPVRTALFVLPPLVLPALAFDLSVGAALVVSVLLLWLAVAAGVVATMMFDGSDHLALRAVERRLDELPAMGGRATDDEALLAVGAQLDALNDRLDALMAGRGADDVAVEHRPQEQWSASEEVDQNDWYDHDVVSGRHWSPPRWER